MERYCIYLTTNKINGKTYVGQHKYKKLYDGYIGSGTLLRRAIKKYGKENFEIEYLETDLTEDEIDWYEQWYINVLNPDYNLKEGGQGARYRSTIASQEYRIKLSNAHIGQTAWNKGKKLEECASNPEEARRNLSLSHIGQTAWNKGKKGPPAWNKGLKTPEETRKKLSQRKLENPVRYWKGSKFSEEHKRKLSESHKGKNNTGSEEYKLYKANGGTMNWNEFQKERKNGRKD